MTLEIEPWLDGVGPVGGIKPEGVGTDGVQREGVDGRRVEDELLMMFEVGGSVAEVAGVPFVPASSVVDEEAVVESCGFACGGAASLFGDSNDVGTGDGGEDESCDERACENACAQRRFPGVRKDEDSEEQDSRWKKGKRLGEIGESECQPQQRVVDEAASALEAKQEAGGQEEKEQQKRVGTDGAEGELALE